MGISKKVKHKNKLGQYFTPTIVADFMIDLATITPQAKILEPACGEGVFIDLLQKKGFQNIVAYEIDEELATHYTEVRHESFISAEIKEKFDLIIGNPPYIRWANLETSLKTELQENILWNQYFNSLCDYLYIFILKSIELLEENGNLIFICPEYWLNTTHSLSLRNYMVQHGYFDIIYHFNETPIFDKVATSTIIFKYIKSKEKKPFFSLTKHFENKKLTKKILETLEDTIEIPQFQQNERWILASQAERETLQVFENECLKNNIYNGLFENKIEYHTLGDFCEIGNGLVSGLDKAFQINENTLTEKEKKQVLQVVKAKDLAPFLYKKITSYIYLEESITESSLQNDFPNFYFQFQSYKNDLEKRYQYNRKINYWEWVFLRNFKLFSRDEKRILVPCKERISHKNYFRFALAEPKIYPTQDVTAVFCKPTTRESIEYIVAFLNNYRVFNWLKYNGIVKGNIIEFSEKPLASIPFRAIDWQNKEDVALHDEITAICETYLKTQETHLLENLDTLFHKLLTK